jgi:hypothetical protein
VSGSYGWDPDGAAQPDRPAPAQGYGWPAGAQPGAVDPYVAPGGPSGPGYPWGGPGPVDHPSGTTVLVLGILALVICPITGIFAITMGNRALREIDADPMAYRNRQSVVIGRILGIVGVAVYGTAIVGYLIFVVAIFGMVGLGAR